MRISRATATVFSIIRKSDFIAKLSDNSDSFFCFFLKIKVNMRKTLAFIVKKLRNLNVAFY